MRTRPVSRIAGAVVILALLAVAWWALAPTQLGGHTAYAVVSGSSMAPSVTRGDFVLVRERASYEPGDVVLYASPRVDENVLHRIVAARGDGFVVKGDTNDFVDGAQPTADEIVGELWLVVPNVGSFVGWVQRPVNAVALLLAAILIALLGGREASRRARRPGEPARARVSVAPYAGPAPSTLRHAAFAALALFSLLAVVSWTRPASRQTVTPGAYAHTGRFSYESSVPRSPVYPDGRVTTGETAFTQLVQRVDVRFAYGLEASGQTDLSGTTRIDATITDGAGWSRTVPVAPERHFAGRTAVAKGTLDLSYLVQLIDQLRTLTGTGVSTFTVVLTPQVRVAGTAGRAVVDSSFLPELPFQFDATALRLADPENADPVLQPREEAAAPATVDSTIRVGPLALTTVDARTVSVLGLVTALALLGVATALLRGPSRGGSVDAGRFRGRIVDVAEAVPSGRWVTDVGDLETLIRISETYERLVVHARDQGRDVYAVDDGVAVYRYATPAWDTPADEARTQVLPARSR